MSAGDFLIPSIKPSADGMAPAIGERKTVPKDIQLNKLITRYAPYIIVRSVLQLIWDISIFILALDFAVASDSRNTGFQQLDSSIR